MATINKKDLLTAGYDIVKVEGNKIGAFDSFYGITDETEYDFPLSEASEGACKDTLTTFELDSSDIITGYNIDNFYGGGVERESFTRAEQFVGKKFAR